MELLVASLLVTFFFTKAKDLVACSIVYYIKGNHKNKDNIEEHEQI